MSREPKVYGYICTSDINIFAQLPVSLQIENISNYCNNNNLKLTNIFLDNSSSVSELNNLLNTVTYGDYFIVNNLMIFEDTLNRMRQYRQITINKACVFICLNPPIDSRSQTANLLLGLYSTMIDHELNLHKRYISEHIEPCKEKLQEQIPNKEKLLNCLVKSTDSDKLLLFCVEQLYKHTQGDQVKMLEILNQQ